MGHFIALKSAIINGEETVVKQYLVDRSMLDVEKSYLLELAELGGNAAIIQLLEQVPVKDPNKSFQA
ncbi:hypothetical protein TOI97_03260 [Denitrificimonas sp. JX-1]|uniref:Uncharacterized protein n=2 Tax=Denitrificimonas halotolerans TaxID=3098930 RepID=A0ABU5GNL9_9GAMM|nr:hypothetical protein [Denitrificimonas sp. JX-1]